MIKRERIIATPEPVVPKRTYPARDPTQELTILYEFLLKGIDAEDIGYFHKSYEGLLSQEALQVGRLLQVQCLSKNPSSCLLVS